MHAHVAEKIAWLEEEKERIIQADNAKISFLECLEIPDNVEFGRFDWGKIEMRVSTWGHTIEVLYHSDELLINPQVTALMDWLGITDVRMEPRSVGGGEHAEIKIAPWTVWFERKGDCASVEVEITRTEIREVCGPIPADWKVVG